MPLPGVPLSTSKVNGTPSVNDHPAHHDAIAAAVNAASTAIDNLASIDTAFAAALAAIPASTLALILATLIAGTGISLVPIGDQLQINATGDATAADFGVAFPYRNWTSFRDFYADNMPLGRKVTGINSPLVQGAIEELAGTVAALVGTGTGLLSYYYVNPNSGNYALAVGTTQVRLTDGSTPVVFPDFVIPASGDIRVYVSGRTGTVSSPSNPKISLLDNTDAVIGSKKFLIPTAANTRFTVPIVALDVGTPGATLTGWGIGGEVASGTENIALDLSNGPFYAEVVALP